MAETDIKGLYVLVANWRYMRPVGVFTLYRWLDIIIGCEYQLVLMSSKTTWQLKLILTCCQYQFYIK